MSIWNNSMQLGIDIFDLYIIYTYMTIFFNHKYINKKLMIIAYAFRLILSVLLNNVPLYPVISVLVSIMSLLSVALCYSSNFSKKITVTIVVYICSFISEGIVALIVGVSGINPFGKIVQGDIFLGIVIELIFWCITVGLKKYKNIAENVPVPKTFMIAMIIIPFSSVCLEAIIFEQDGLNSSKASISLICIFASNFIMVYLYDHLSKMFQERTYAAIILREKNYYQEQSEMLKKQHEDLRQFRHDIKNRMIVIQQMINKNEQERVLEYTKQIESKLEQTAAYSMTGNIAIDSIINYKLTQAKERKVDVDVEIVLPENIAVKEDDIIVILGNILDNAIEAVELLEKDKFINLTVGYEKGVMFIHIKNSYDSLVNVSGGKLLTRKKEKNMHGIGLQSVNNVIEKYNGLMELEYSDSEFSVDILLYV